jgi:hypothetical protein
MHDRAGNEKLCAVDFTPRQWDRSGYHWGLRRKLPGDRDRKSKNAHRGRIRIAQQRQTQMNIDVLAGLRAAVQFAFESPFLKNGSNRMGGEKRLLSNAIDVGNVSADQIFRRIAVSIYTLVTAGDDSVKVSGEDRVL